MLQTKEVKRARVRFTVAIIMFSVSIRGANALFFINRKHDQDNKENIALTANYFFSATLRRPTK